MSGGSAATVLVCAVAVGLAAWSVHQGAENNPYLQQARTSLLSFKALGYRGVPQSMQRSGASDESTSTIKTTPLLATPSAAACGIAGNVAGCGCDFASTESIIHNELHPLLAKLVKVPFFRYFKVNLYCDCEFWPDAGMCFSKDCCVEACEDSELPEPWRREQAQLATQQHQLAQGQQDQQQQQHACSDPISPVDRRVDEQVAAELSSVPNWSGLNNPWVPEDDEKDVEYIYVNLQLNPERYTGYKGEDARRIWASIYAQSAFEGVHGATAGGSSVPDAVLEKQVLYRLISGMHSSITTSIIQNYYNETTGTWGPNLPFFKARFTGPAARPYVENLYFTCLFLLRAVMKARAVLDSIDYNTGSPDEEAMTRDLVHQLAGSPVLLASCPEPFNEGLLWQDREPAERHKLEQQLQVAFHNITKLMDCVGCEKCKMWGKLQMLGIATSLKILFSSQQQQGPSGLGSDVAAPPASLQLHRNEVIALVNLLHKVADSVETVRQLSLLVASEGQR